MAKKKEDKIIDYLQMSEEEKISLLREYKKMYELQKILEEQGIKSDKRTYDDALMTSSDIVENVNNVDEMNIEIDIVDVDSEQVHVEDKTESSIKVEDNNIKDVNTVVAEEVKGINTSNTVNGEKKSSFEYTSFTPYKPKFDDMDLDNNMFDFNAGNMTKSTSDDYVEKYQMKSKPHVSLKTSQDGRYKYSDSYIATKEKKNIPYFNILVVLFSISSFTIYVAGTVHYFNIFEYMECVLNLVYGISAFLVFMSAITKNKIILKYSTISVICVFVVDVIILSITKYKDYLYMVISPEKPDDVTFGIISLVGMLSKYVFLIMIYASFRSESKKLTYASTFVGLIASGCLCVVIYFENLRESLVMYYDILPGSLAIVLFLISLIFSGYERINR